MQGSGFRVQGVQEIQDVGSRVSGALSHLLAEGVEVALADRMLLVPHHHLPTTKVYLYIYIYIYIFMYIYTYTYTATSPKS